MDNPDVNHCVRNLIATMLLEDRSDLRRLKDEMAVRDAVAALYESSSSSSESESEPEDPQDESPDFEDHLDAMTDKEFKSQMRINRATVEYLTAQYAASQWFPQYYGGKVPIGAKKSIYLFVWYVTNEITFRLLGELFEISMSAAWSTVHRITGFLISISHEHIKWPEDKYMEEVVNSFEQKNRMPGVIGVIDCMHIAVRTPKEQQKEIYLNRKGVYSIILQAVVDTNKKFIDITCGEPGSLHECEVLERSELYELAESDHNGMFPNSYYIIGDAAYPSNKWLVSPFKTHEDLTESQRKFNDIHSSTRSVIQEAFNLLKSRFPRLAMFTEQTDLKALTNITASLCVLHNICISMDDFCQIVEENIEETEQPEELREESDLDGSNDRRAKLFNHLRQKNIL